MIFRDRFEAGRFLAGKLTAYRQKPDVLVLALPRGGVPVAFEVAKALDAPLEIFLVRKLGLPGYEELAMGAVATGGVLVLNEDVVNRLDVSEAMIEQVALRERQELARQHARYLHGRPSHPIEARTVILIDDGLATGTTMRAAIAALRRRNPTRIVVAVPVGAPETCSEFSELADEVVCATHPERFTAVGAWYRDFSPTSDEEVEKLLDAAAAKEALSAGLQEHAHDRAATGRSL